MNLKQSWAMEGYKSVHVEKDVEKKNLELLIKRAIN